jgi:hypothetical protein
MALASWSAQPDREGLRETGRDCDFAELPRGLGSVMAPELHQARISLAPLATRHSKPAKALPQL